MAKPLAGASGFLFFTASQGCATCHNTHEHSPKKDWKLGDIMGAVTWIYPRKTMSTEESLGVVRQAFRGAYISYLSKAKTLRQILEIPAGAVER